MQRFRFLLGLALTGFVSLASIGAAAENAPAAAILDFDVLTSVQYGHTDIYYHTPPGVTPVLARTKEIAPGQRVDLLLVVSRFATDAADRASVSYDLTVRYPDGRVQASTANVVAAQLKVQPHTLLFPRKLQAFATALTDPFGAYQFEVTVHDGVSGQSRTKTVSVEVANSNRPLPLPENFDANEWIARYYLRPEPRFALPALEALSRNPALLAKGVDGLGTILGFYGQVLVDNPWLLPWFKQWFLSSEGDERHLLALVFAHAQRINPAMTADLIFSSRKAVAAASRELPVHAGPPETSSQLDMLWGRFYAGGYFGPIEAMVEVVGHDLPYAGQLDAFRQLAHPPATPPPEVMKSALLNATLWSLRLNAAQHKLVRDYLGYLQQTPETPPAVKAALAGVLAWKPGAF